MSDFFDWDSDEDLVVRTRRGLAVYLNTRDEIVLRQEARSDEHEDPVVLILRDDALRVARAILEAAGLTEPPLALPNPAQPMTPAERSRRYRESKRHAPSRSVTTARDEDLLMEAAE